MRYLNIATCPAWMNTLWAGCSLAGMILLSISKPTGFAQVALFVTAVICTAIAILANVVALIAKEAARGE